MSPAGLVKETEAIRQAAPERGVPLGPPLALRKFIPFEPCAASDRLGWVDLEAARYSVAPASERNPPALTHDRLVLFSRPPQLAKMRILTAESIAIETYEHRLRNAVVEARSQIVAPRQFCAWTRV
jgi:hypothetical protein